MTDLMKAVKWFLSSSWQFFTEIEVPGLGIPFAYLFVGLFLAVFGLRLLLFILGLNAGGSGTVVSSAKLADTNKPKSVAGFGRNL